MQDKNQEVSKQNIGDDPINSRPNVVRGMVSVKKGGDTTSVDAILIIIELDGEWDNNNSSHKINTFHFGGTEQFDVRSYTPTIYNNASLQIYSIAFEFDDTQEKFRGILAPSIGPWTIDFPNNESQTENFATLRHE